MKAGSRCRTSSVAVRTFSTPTATRGAGGIRQHRHPRLDAELHAAVRAELIRMSAVAGGGFRHDRTTVASTRSARHIRKIDDTVDTSAILMIRKAGRTVCAAVWAALTPAPSTMPSSTQHGAEAMTRRMIRGLFLADALFLRATGVLVGELVIHSSLVRGLSTVAAVRSTLSWLARERTTDLTQDRQLLATPRRSSRPAARRIRSPSPRASMIACGRRGRAFHQLVGEHLQWSPSNRNRPTGPTDRRCRRRSISAIAWCRSAL